MKPGRQSRVTLYKVTPEEPEITIIEFNPKTLLPPKIFGVSSPENAALKYYESETTRLKDIAEITVVEKEKSENGWRIGVAYSFKFPGIIGQTKTIGKPAFVFVEKVN